MKKLLFFLSFALCFAVSHAQTAIKLPLVAGDTITNTGTSSKIIQVTSAPSGIIVEALLTKVSGTGAGTVVLQGCNSGVNYTTIGSSYTITNTASQSAYFSVASPLPQYLRVLATGSGNESVVMTTYYRLPKYQTNTP